MAQNGETAMRLARTLAVCTLALAPMLAVPALSADAAEATFRSEVAAHPRLARAIRQLEADVRMLEAAPADFGGNKAAAIQDMHRAIHSLRKALFFRVRADDAAIDHAPI
jgi:hypothetical protein